MFSGWGCQKKETKGECSLVWGKERKDQGSKDPFSSKLSEGTEIKGERSWAAICERQPETLIVGFLLWFFIVVHFILRLSLCLK